jgi:hypothetical protein
MGVPAVSVSRSKKMDVPRPDFGLAKLLGLRSSEGFLRGAWPESLFVHHGTLQRFSDLQSISAFASGRAFLEAWRGDAHAWPPSGSRDAIERRTGKAIRAAYESGWTIYCMEVEKQRPEIGPVIRRLEADLSLRHGDVTCQVIATRRGHVGKPHFDADCTFNLQLQGKKRWCVVANDSVAFPHVTGRIGEPMPSAIAPYATGPFPSSMPRDARRFTTKPGSVVYLPHGCWHSTICESDSLSLLFVLTGPKWFELFLGEIRRELVRLREARRMSLLGPGADVRSARKVLERLRTVVSAMDAEALLTRWTGPPPIRFRKCDGASIAVAAENAPLRSILKWLSRAPSTFELDDVVEACRETKRSELLKSLDVLARLRVIEVVPNERPAGRRRRRSRRRAADCRA